MCPYKEWFNTYQSCDASSILMGSDAGSILMGNDACFFQSYWNRHSENKVYDGIVKTLGNVPYIHKLKKNLISLEILHSLGYSFSVKDRLLKVYK